MTVENELEVILRSASILLEDYKKKYADYKTRVLRDKVFKSLNAQAAVYQKRLLLEDDHFIITGLMKVRTLQELADFYGMFFTVDAFGRCQGHTVQPYRTFDGWDNDAHAYYGVYSWMYRYSGDWKKSLAIPRARKVL